MKTLSEIQIELIKRGYSSYLVFNEEIELYIKEGISSAAVKGAKAIGARAKEIGKEILSVHKNVKPKAVAGAIWTGVGAAQGIYTGKKLLDKNPCLKKCDPKLGLKLAGLWGLSGGALGYLAGKQSWDALKDVAVKKGVKGKVGGAVKFAAIEAGEGVAEDLITTPVVALIGRRYRGLCMANCKFEQTKNPKYKKEIEKRVNEIHKDIVSLRKRGMNKAASKLQMLVSKAMK